MNETANSVVRVKPLEWTDFDDRGARASAFLNSSYLIQMWRGRGEFEVSVSVPGYQSAFDGKRFHTTIDDAKAAAQADYEARILSAIEPVTVQSAARVLDEELCEKIVVVCGFLEHHPAIIGYAMKRRAGEIVRALAQSEEGR